MHSMGCSPPFLMLSILTVCLMYWLVGRTRTQAEMDRGRLNLPLLQHCGAGRFPVWSNVGTNANAHLVNPRNLAEAWRVLNGSTP